MTGRRAARRRVLDDAIAELDVLLEGDAPFSPRALARALRAVLWVLRDDARGAPPTAASASPLRAAPASDGLRRRATVEAQVLAPGRDPTRTAGSDRAPPPAAPPAPTPAAASRVGSGPAVASDAAARQALARFDLADINRWLATGTLFQMRGDLAYLNLTASERLAFDFREKLRDLGFAEELGVLEGHALQGEVLLFRRRG